MVSIAHHVRKFYPSNPASNDDIAAAGRGDQLFNRLFIEAIVNGSLDSNANGVMDPGEPIHDPALAHRADYIGINYYSLTLMKATTVIPLLRAIPLPDEQPHGLPKTDSGWDIHPRGFYNELVWAGGYGLPIVVTENGIADHSDANRPRFLAEHVATMLAAVQSGVHVVGYFYWATIDNFEWVAGYCPRFGLYSVDYTSAMRTRSPRPSAMLYRTIIDSGEVTDTLLGMQPAYVSATAFCVNGAMPDAGR
jgi:beta-glucosidase/6-phospho-beta-glucosidase/beta-galactosidase